MADKAAIILTNYRTGGSWLSLCLDSHPLIFCARMEPLSVNSVWAALQVQGFDKVAILKSLFDHRLCRVAMLKIVYRQAGPKVWKYLVARKAKVVHLVRNNELRAACSHMYFIRFRRGEIDKDRKLHNFDIKNIPKPDPIKLDPHEVLQMCRARAKQRKKTLKQLEKHGLPMVRVVYEELTNDGEAEEVPEKTAQVLCRFLRVPHFPLRAPFMRRVNPFPLKNLIRNWMEFKNVIQETEFGQWLEM